MKAHIVGTPLKKDKLKGKARRELEEFLKKEIDKKFLETIGVKVFDKERES